MSSFGFAPTPVFKRGFYIAISFLIIVFISISSNATTKRPIIAFDDLAGFNRIAYSVYWGANTYDEIIENDIDFDELLGKALKESFQKTDLTLPIDKWVSLRWCRYFPLHGQISRAVSPE